MDISIVICTHNRAESLRLTLGGLQALSTARRWETIVVDNACSDHTEEVVFDAARRFPVALTYLRESEPGKYAALNTGIRAARGAIIAATDDDALPAVDWLDQLADGLERCACAFVGGPVRPIWHRPVPPWLSGSRSVYWKVLALQDYGDQLREYGVGIGWPLGVNVAYRRDVFAPVGLFDNRLGRIAGTLRNQSQREWHLRARAAGARGFYLPGMLVHHAVAADRLTKNYFRRWYYWHGVSRAILSRTTGLDVEEPERAGLQPEVARLRGVPVRLFSKAFRSAVSCVRRRLRGQEADAFTYELFLWFFLGVLRECAVPGAVTAREREQMASASDTDTVTPLIPTQRAGADGRDPAPAPIAREELPGTGAKS